MPLTILVADDDLGTRLSISDYLEIAGYWVVTAENGIKALEMVSEYKPHLLITDITMPGLDGYELVQTVRRQPNLRLLPVIFLTAHTNTEERIRGYQLGCDLYLPKPFELGELGAVVRNLLDRSQLIETEWRSRLPSEREVGKDPSSALSDLDLLPQVPALTALALTQREQDVLIVLTEGLSNAQIGDRLHLSPRTIEKHVSSLLRKTETSNRAELVRYAMQRRLV